MSTMAENVIAVGADNRPHMLEKIPDTSTTPESTIQRTYDDLTNKEKIHEECDIRATIIVLQGEADTWLCDSGTRGNATGSGVNRNMWTTTINQAKVVCCYNYQGEGHMARQCTKLKRPKNSEWFNEKVSLAQDLEAGVVLDEEHMAFLAYDMLTIATGQDTQELTTTAIFQTDDLDAFNLDCDEAPSASAVLMAKLSAYNSDVLSEVQNLDTYQNNNEIDQSVQEIKYSEKPPFINE
nr:hypothetical protein [Tanacetum cinerariifolium]